MKKKYRDINIDNVPFAWRYLGDEFGGILRIWKDGAFLKEIPVDDFMSPMTPGLVEKFIRKFILNQVVAIPMSRDKTMEYFGNLLRHECGHELHLSNIITTEDGEYAECVCPQCQVAVNVNVEIVGSV